MPQSTKTEEARHAKRNGITHTACQNCREKRAKCTGETPCNRCESRNLSCHYATRSWESKNSLREAVDHYHQQLQQRDRLLDAVSAPIVGQFVLQHLREHGIEKTYENLDILQGGCAKDSLDAGYHAVNSGQDAPGPDADGLETIYGTIGCSGALDCRCMTCWPVSSVLNSASGVSPSSRSTLSINSVSTVLDHFASAQPSYHPLEGRILGNNMGCGILDRDPVGSAVSPGLVHGSLGPNNCAPTGWLSQDEPDSSIWELTKDSMRM